MFSPDNGAGYDLRGVWLNMDRASGDVEIRFDSRLGADVLRFRGRLERISNNVIEARLYEGVNQGDAAPAEGRARILLSEGSRVRSVAIDGVARGVRFRVTYSE
jgi:hypothetical protein